MAGVFDIDLETEEGSDGEEPELGAVSAPGTWGHREGGDTARGRRGERGDGIGSGDRGMGRGGTGDGDTGTAWESGMPVEVTVTWWGRGQLGEGGSWTWWGEGCGIRTG